MTEEEVTLEQLIVAANVLEGRDDSISTEEANRMLCEFKVDENAFLHTEEIVCSEAPLVLKHTVFQALTLTIDSRWNIIEPEVKGKIRDFVKTFIIEWPEESKILPNVASKSLIAILNKEYPQNWPNFIFEMLQIAGDDIKKLSNCLDLFTDFFAAIKDSASVMRTQARSNRMESFVKRNGIKNILGVIQQILTTPGSDHGLISSALHTLAHCVKWTYPFELFQSDIFQVLSDEFLEDEHLAVDAIPVLAEVAQNIRFPDDQLHCIMILFNLIVKAIEKVSDDNNKMLIDYISALAIYFEHYGYIIDQPFNREPFAKSLEIAWAITERATDEILFELCMEFWYPFCLRMSMQFKQNGVISDEYLAYKSMLVRVIINKMKSPYDIVLNVDDYGIETTSLKKTSVESIKCLQLLTEIDEADTAAAFGEVEAAMEADFDGKVFDSLCWSVAAIAGHCSQEMIEGYVYPFLNKLQESISGAQDPDYIDVLARGLVYITAQFFKNCETNQEVFYHYVSIIFDYISQASEMESLQYVALSSLADIAEKRANRILFTIKIGENDPLLQTIIGSFNEMLTSLNPDGKIKYITIVSSIASVLSDHKQEVMQSIIDYLNSQWESIISSADLSNIEFNRSVFNLANCIKRIPVEAADVFALYLVEHIPQYIEVLNGYAEVANQLVESEGDYENFKQVKANIAAIVGIVHKFLSFAQPGEFMQYITNDFLSAILAIYSGSNPLARVSNIIDFFSTLIIRNDYDVELSNSILENIYAPTIEMIKEDFDQFAEFRPCFFQLMHSFIVKSEFMTNFPTEKCVEFVDCIKWGTQHPQPEISTYCFTCLKELMEALINVANEETKELFNTTIYPETLLFAFNMLSDVTYKFAFNEEAELIFMLVKNELLQNFLADIVGSVAQIFPDQDPDVVNELFLKLVSVSEEQQGKNILLDFIVKVKEISPYDPQLRRAETEAKLNLIQHKLQFSEGINSKPTDIQDTPLDPRDESFLAHLKNMHFS